MGVVNNGYIYVLGGYTGSGFTNSVYYASINTDGTIGNWVPAEYNLPGPGGYIGCVVNNGYIYVLGGFDGDASTNSVYYASIIQTCFLCTTNILMEGNMYKTVNNINIGERVI